MTEDSLVTGKQFKAMFMAGARCLEGYKEAVNALNVFPVPDGDTGTNMCLTVAAAVREMDKVTSPSLAEMVKALSLGSLMGARGNSGVILSQFFRGWSKSLQDRRTATPLQLAWAMQEGVETAYKAVMKPVEGTILTVAREMARASLQAAKKGLGLEEVLAAGVVRGREVLERTPDMLPVLKQAGVVDAGGSGLLRIMEGLLQGLTGEDVAAPTTAAPEVVLRTEPERDGPPADHEIVFAYDTQLLIKGVRLAVDRIRADLEPLGDSLLVVGDPHLVKVHVHTNEPHRALALCLGHGEIVEASVENMREQHAAVQEARLAAASPDEARDDVGGPGSAGVASQQPYAQVFSLPETGAASRPEGPGVVVVSTGAGLEDIFRNLGADVVVSGGQTMNPSTEDLLRAVESLPHDEVLILPNNGNILLAAKQTIELTEKKVSVVPSRSVPQGVSALMALNRAQDAGWNLGRMEQAIRRVKSGEVTYAVRDSKYNDIEIREGDFIGLLDDEIVTVGADALSVLEKLVGRMADAETDIVTVFYGLDVRESEIPGIRQAVLRAAPGHEIEVHWGGQPLYHFLVSVE